MYLFGIICIFELLHDFIRYCSIIILMVITKYLTKPYLFIYVYYFMNKLYLFINN
jgi:hypothetical protein